MAFDGNGNWISNFSAVADRNADIKILASRFDNIFIADIAESFENCLTKDMQIKPEQNFDANNFRIIDVANPVFDNDAVNLATLNDRISKIEQDPILAYKWSDYEINDASWLNANTFSWHDGTVYTNAYTHLYNDLEDITSSTETVGSYTITYYLAEDGHKIVMPDQETTVQNIYAESGVAWYYILDTDNQRFKLPRENPNREALLNKVGVIPYSTTDSVPYATYKRADLGDNYDLPMQGGYYASYSNGWVTVGATNANYGHPLAWGSKTGLGVDLSSGTGTYKGQKYLYFYVGEFTQSAIEQTAGITTNQLAQKVDIDFGNLTSAGKATIVGLCMPDYSSGISTNTPYTAPKDGFIVIARNNSATQAGIKINDVTIQDNKLYNDGQYLVSSGDIITDATSASGNIPLKFFPMKGVENA